MNWLVRNEAATMARVDNNCEQFVADCRLRAATELFAHTWDPMILAALSSGPRRRGELRVDIGGITDKVLTEALRRLLAYGLVTRRSFAEVPPRTQYALSELGHSLVKGPMKALGAWTLEHGEELLNAHERPTQTLRRSTNRSRSAT